MRGDHSFSTKTETAKQRSLRMKRNRLIRKQKLYGMVVQVEEPESKQTTNNREEKQYVQKLKNRQAAQKSRQQKKMYVTELQQQIKLLKHVTSHCQRCQKHLQTLQTTTPQQQLYLYPPTSQLTPLHQPSTFQQQHQIQQQTSSFIRMSSTQEHSSIGIYLFVFMIMLGVFCIGTRMDGVGDGVVRRELTQVMVDVGLGGRQGVGYEYESNMKSTYSTLNQAATTPSTYHTGLLSMYQFKSPSSLADDTDFQHIISQFQNSKLHQYNQKNLRSTVSLINSNKSLMFCSRPKIYKSDTTNQGVFSSFIDIFVKGAQIMRIFPQSSDLSTPNSLHLDGLYKITASVEEIQEIGSQSFIY